MNIYLKEMKDYRKSIIIWSISILLFIAMGMEKYSVIETGPNNGEELLNIINSMPKALQTLWGMSTIDITTPIGFYSVLFFYLALIAAIHAVMLGANIVLKEERDKTVEFLMIKPVSKFHIICSKLLTALTNILIFNIVVTLSSILLLKNYTDEPIINTILMLMLGLFFIQLIFMIVGMSSAMITKKATIITMSYLLFSFFLSIIIDLNDKLKILSFLTPFKYFDSKEILLSNSLNVGYIILSIIIIAIILPLAYHKYNNKDFNI